MIIRVGQGIDIHRFGVNRPLLLGGVEIPHQMGLEGHSDADVLLHAIIDSLLGAAGKSDIGVFFPNHDPKWKNASSLLLLEKAWGTLKAEGWQIQNLDVSLVLEAPKISPYIPQMKARIAAVLGIEVGQCAIKATTAEGLGFVGRAEGIFASSVCLLTRNS